MRFSGFFLLILMVVGCGGPRASDYQAKIDSLRQAAQIKEMKSQGLLIDESNPFQVFFELLAVQPLPLTYSENYVNTCPNYMDVPEAMAKLLKLEDDKNMKAISLPERDGVRLLLVATLKDEVVQELWLYSLDLSYYPVDQMCIYDVTEQGDGNFAITSNYEIYRNDTGYYVNSEYQFQEYIELGEDSE